MLSENQIIEAVCMYLESKGYRVIQRLTTNERGVDIVARSAGPNVHELRIEAKGETSDRQGSARYGKPFNSAQVSDHVANAFYCAATMLEGVSVGFDVRAGIALPDTPRHRLQIAKIQRALAALGVAVYWVDAQRRVSVESATAAT